MPSLPKCPAASCEECKEPFLLTRPNRLYCSERCRRVAENRRYRQRHIEEATCPGCGEVFTRTATSRRKKVHCSTRCQYATRSREYSNRPEILEGLARARRTRGGTSSTSRRTAEVGNREKNF
jgi:hypothetical protein